MLSVYNLSRSRIVLLDVIAMIIAGTTIVCISFLNKSMSDPNAGFSFEAIFVLSIIYAIAYFLVILPKWGREILASNFTPLLVAGFAACLYVIASIVFSSFKSSSTDLPINLTSYVGIMLVIFIITLLLLLLVRSIGKLLSSNKVP